MIHVHICVFVTTCGIIFIFFVSRCICLISRLFSPISYCLLDFSNLTWTTVVPRFRGRRRRRRQTCLDPRPEGLTRTRRGWRKQRSWQKRCEPSCYTGCLPGEGDIGSAVFIITWACLLQSLLKGAITNECAMRHKWTSTYFANFY